MDEYHWLYERPMDYQNGDKGKELRNQKRIGILFFFVADTDLQHLEDAKGGTLACRNGREDCLTVKNDHAIRAGAPYLNEKACLRFG